MAAHGQLTPPNERPNPTGLKDDPFLEQLFETMCRHLFVLRGDSFVDQANRWAHALRYMASLKPVTQPEWLLAADVTMQHFFALHSLALGRGKGVRMKRRIAHGKEFIARAMTMHAARLRYDLLKATSDA
jgi:hypothetical protein